MIARICFAVAVLWIPARTGNAPTVALIGGLQGRDETTAAIERVKGSIAHYNVAAIPLANPDGSELALPPSGIAYRENGPSHYLWRWLFLHGPDLVVIVGDRDYGLQAALGGRIPVVRAKPSPSQILRAIPKQIAISEAHRELERRLARTPREVAEQLARVYGHDFEQPVYVPAMALIGRLRLGQQADVMALVEPYVNGSRDSMAKPTSSHFAGHLIFAELYQRTRDPRYMDRVGAAANVATTLHNEMSDAVFMGCPILAAAGRYDTALRHLRFMQKLCLRPDGLYRHSPLNEAAWGRGNAFPALGVAWALQYLPAGHPAHAEMIRSLNAHLAALSKFQDSEGMWHEVIDRPDSYAEFSATAMIAAAMLRGVKHGWLDTSYRDRAHKAWGALLKRIGPDGELIDVCESTGKQKTLDDYLNRAASYGKDARGGGMALLLATETLE